jgi:hypothetical protein
MSPEELKDASISPTTIRIAVGDEDPRELIVHFIQVCELILNPVRPGFSSALMRPAEIDELYRRTYLEMHTSWIESHVSTETLLK